METVSYKLLKPEATPFKRGSGEAAGYDIVASQDTKIPARGRKLIKTGIAIAIQSGYYGQIWSRSSMAVKGIDVGAGVIDSDYRGEVRVLLINHTDEPFQIQAGNRIAQIIFYKHQTPEMIPTSVLPDTVRGKGGFGSTGV